MALSVRLLPEAGGTLLLDGESYDPRLPYPPGSVVDIMIRPMSGYQFAGWTGDVPVGCQDDVPLQVTVGEAPQEVIAHFVPVRKDVPELVFDADFENGNGILRYNLRNSRGLVIEPLQLNAADNIWWHFKIHGITPGEFLQLQIVHSPATEPDFAGDSHPVYSYDGVTWHRFIGAKSPFIQKFIASSVEIARNIPYPYSKTLALAKEMTGPYVQTLDLATSERGRPVKAFRFTDPGTPGAGKRIVWVMARQHAFESHSSWYAEYLCRWLLGDDPFADDLRRQAITYIVPIMDVDNVYAGGSGKEQLGANGRRADFNRSWAENGPWAAIRAAQRLLERLREQHDIAAFFDLHSPWYPNSPSWHIPSILEEQGRYFADIWSAALKDTGTGVRWKHRLMISGRGDQDANREPSHMVTSTQYATQRLLDQPADHIYMVIETAHWHDGYGSFITLDSLRAYATALGRALVRFWQNG